ncbi:MAG: hypothetical protein IT195_12580 [Microthrixaceae bacterium]|nr:hypothetical protein [Microthrixaceae bacterium]
MTIKPAIWAATLYAWAAGNLIVAIDTVIPGGAAQAWAAGLVTAVAAAAGALLVRNMRANKQLVDQYIQLLEDERHAHRETRQELRDAMARIGRLERKVQRIQPE